MFQLAVTNKGRSHRRREVDRRLRQALAGDLIFTDHVFVRHRRRGATWRNWNAQLNGGPVVRVRVGSVELKAPQGMMLETRHIVMCSRAVTMTRDRIGLWGLPLARRDCIILAGHDVSGWARRLAVSNDDLTVLWDALERAGVSAA